MTAPRKSLLLPSLLVFSVFVLIVIGLQYVFLQKVLSESSGQVARLSPAEVELYKTHLRGLGTILQTETENLEGKVFQLRTKIEPQYVANQIDGVQRLLNQSRPGMPFSRDLFLFNRFGRLLAVSPFDEARHNNVFDFARYYVSLTATLLQTRQPAAYYYYLLDDQIIGEGLTPEVVSQPPFAAAKGGPGVNRKLGHRFLDLQVARETPALAGLPLFVFGSPYFRNRQFSGFAGFTVPLSHFVDLLKDNSAENLMALFILNRSGYCIYYPENGASGSYAGDDPLVRAVLNDSQKPDYQGLLSYQGRLVFYHRSGPFVLMGVPFKYFGALPEGIADLFGPLPPLAWVFFGFEVFLFGLLFVLFYRRIILSLRRVIGRHAPDSVPMDFENEIEALDGLMSLPGEDGKIETFIFEPGLNTSLAAKVDEEREDLTVKDLRKTEATAVYISLKNLSRFVTQNPSFIVNYVRLIYRMAIDHDGVVRNSAFNSLMVYFGAEQDDPEHATKAARFINTLLKLTKRLNHEEKLKIKIGVAADTAEFTCGRFVLGRREEMFIASKAVSLIQKYELLTGSNAAVLGEAFYRKTGDELDKACVAEKVRIKVRDWFDPLDVYVYKV